MRDNARMQETPTSATRTAWHVLGAGAMGCLWASSLANAGHAVRLLLREPPACGSDASITLIPHPADSLREETLQVPVWLEAARDNAPIARLLACTKAPDLLPALEHIAPRIADGAAVVLLQNGMGFHAAVTSLLPRARIFCALSTEGAYREGSLHVRHAGSGETLLGALAGSANSGATELADELGRGFLPVRAVEDIIPALWAKLAVNCAINPLTALHGCSNGELLDRPVLRREFDALCAEITSVLAGLGHPQLAATVAADAARVARATAANRSSMRQDLEAGRRSEIGFITGFLCQQAQSSGLHCPLNEALLAAVRQREQA
jgi:2-dehydropantoate 2-reductase